jgi:hypothetical protein
MPIAVVGITKSKFYCLIFQTHKVAQIKPFSDLLNLTFGDLNSLVFNKLEDPRWELLPPKNPVVVIHDV